MIAMAIIFGLIFYGMLGMFVNLMYSVSTDFEYEFMEDERTLAYMIFWPLLVLAMIWKGIVYVSVNLPKSVASAVGSNTDQAKGFTAKSFTDLFVSKD